MFPIYTSRISQIKKNVKSIFIIPEMKSCNINWKQSLFATPDLAWITH